MFIKDGDSAKNESLFGKVQKFLCSCEHVGGGGGAGESYTFFYNIIFIYVTSLTGLLQVWPTFENVIVNSSLDWDEQTRVGNFNVFEGGLAFMLLM